MNNTLDKQMHDSIEKAFRKADTDGDGRLSLDEIIFVCKVCPHPHLSTPTDDNDAGTEVVGVGLVV